MMKKVFCLVISILLAVGLSLSDHAMAGTVPKVVSFATKPMGGAIYYISAGMAAVFTKHAGVKVKVQPTRGIKEWGPLMEAGQIELAIDNAVAAAAAYRAIGVWKVGDKRLTRYRMLAAGQETLMAFWTRPDTGIKSIEDFVGKRIVMCTPPGAPNTTATGNLIEEYYELKGKYNRLLIGSPSECTNALIEGKIDAYQFVPGPHIEQLRRTCGVRAVPVPKEAVEYIASKVSGMYPGAIPKGMFGLEAAVPCTAWRGVMVAREDLDAQFIYKLLDTLYSHLDELHGVHPRAKQWVLENATKAPTVPFHEGAIRYYKDKGLWTKELEKINQQNLAVGK